MRFLAYAFLFCVIALALAIGYVQAMSKNRRSFNLATLVFTNCLPVVLEGAGQRKIIREKNIK